MTREQVMALEGRELDKAIARAAGYRVDVIKKESWCHRVPPALRNKSANGNGRCVLRVGVHVFRGLRLGSGAIFFHRSQRRPPSRR